VLSGIRLVRDVPYTGSRQVDVVGALLSIVGMGGIVLGILVWQEGGEAVGLLLALGAASLGTLVWWLVRRKRAGQPPKTQDEIIRINTQARHLALQIALLIPILAGLGGLLISSRMMRQPDPKQSGSGEQAVLG
jgi:hypothetical protein